MTTALIAGLFALGGVTLGVAFEPIKAKVAFNARQRETRAERSAALIEAAMLCRSRLLWLFQNLRRPEGERDELRPIEEQYWDARNDLKRFVMLLRISGPDVLIEKAEAVKQADFELRKLWFELERPNAAVLSQVLKNHELAVQVFADVARIKS
jgi:hypothetical protein